MKIVLHTAKCISDLFLISRLLVISTISYLLAFIGKKYHLNIFEGVRGRWISNDDKDEKFNRMFVLAYSYSFELNPNYNILLLKLLRRMWVTATFTVIPLHKHKESYSIQFYRNKICESNLLKYWKYLYLMNILDKLY